MTDEDDDDVINENDLLDEKDKVKPDPSDLKGKHGYAYGFHSSEIIQHLLPVCGTTGKRKACKDCSCGLGEELAAEGKQNTQSTETAKSSCGSVSSFLL